MSKGTTLAGILTASVLMAFVVTPSADPVATLLNACAILCIAIPSYFVGLRQSKTCDPLEGNP